MMHLIRFFGDPLGSTRESVCNQVVSQNGCNLGALKMVAGYRISNLGRLVLLFFTLAWLGSVQAHVDSRGYDIHNNFRNTEHDDVPLVTEGNAKRIPGKISGNMTFLFKADLKRSSDLPIHVLIDHILYNTELLVPQGINTTADLGPVTSSVRIIDKTATNPSDLVVTIGDGAIFYNGAVSVSLSLPVGVITDQPIDILLRQGLGSSLNGTPAPIFPVHASIPEHSGVGYFNVSGFNTNEIPAILIIEGSANGFRVNAGAITLYKKRIHEFMSLSANGDKIHDYSEIQNIEKYPDNEVDIIDRWGVLVWRAKGYNNQGVAFTGKSNQGNPYDLLEGTYYYVIRFYDENGELNVFKGSLQLKRGISEY